MAHVSRPVLILIGATAVLIALWLVALRPKPVPVEDTPLAATKAIPQATQAAATSDAANAKVQAAAAGDGSGAAPAAAQPTAAAPASAPAKAAKAATAKAATAKAVTAKAAAAATRGERRNAALVRAIADGKVVVLLFWNAKSADDIATRGVLRDLDLHGGKVITRVVRIEDVAQYTAVTRGVKIAQSPTTVVIGRKGDARVIVGLTEPRELSQAVGDALAGR